MEPLLKILSDKCQSLYFLIFNTHFNFFYFFYFSICGVVLFEMNQYNTKQSCFCCHALVLKSQTEEILQDFGSKQQIFHLSITLLGIKSCCTACGWMLLALHYLVLSTCSWHNIICCFICKVLCEVDTVFSAGGKAEKQSG